METLEDLFAAALLSIGGADRFVSGASLGAKAHSSARVAGMNLRDELKAAHRTVVEVLSASPRFDVVERPNTDFLVRLRKEDLAVAEEGASVARIPPSQRLRDDVYAAFTRTQKRFVYNKRTDSFYAISADEIAENTVSIPPVTQEQLLNDREVFAETLAEPIRDSAGAALKGEHPLTAFKNLLIAHRCFEQWIGFHNQLLVPRLREWADASGVTISDAWFQSASKTTDNAFRTAVHRIIMAMPDDDLAQIAIPLKYIRLLLPQ